MMSARGKLLAAAAAVIIWVAIQPGTVSGQTSGVGGDGYTRVLWRSTNGVAGLGILDIRAPYPTLYAFLGPFVGWSPIAITTARNNNTYVLWRHTNNYASLWVFDQSLF